MNRKLAVPLTVILLLVITLAVFWQVRHCGFVNYDDNLYVTNNPHVQSGLNWENIKWAFRTFDTGNWHPLTWISLMLDARDGVMDAKPFHTTNLWMHLANVALLFLILRRLTKSTWRSAFVAALFAVHPLHVESVAWVSQRKDVLSTLFWLVVMWAYVRYTEKPSIRRYVPVFILFALGLMSKSMLVTRPLALLLLDYWPLGRVKCKEDGLRVVLEKIPLFVQSIAVSIVTFYAQEQGRAVAGANALPVTERLSNATASYVLYLYKMLWPAKLAVLYPLPGQVLPAWLMVLSGAFLVGVTALVIRSRRRYPYLAVGWLWYIITLIPVIGIIQVGEQAMADRYTYMPIVGIFVMIAWGVPELVRKRGRKGDSAPNTQHLTPNTIPLAIAAIAAVAVLGACTFCQVGYWQDSITLFTHAIRSARNYHTAHLNLGIALAEAGRMDEATHHLREAVNLRPDLPMLHYNLARALSDQARYGEAIQEYETAIQADPTYPESHNGAAVALFLSGDYANAWREVHEYEGLGGAPHPEFVRELSEKMPDPRR